MALINTNSLFAQWRGLDNLPIVRQIGLLIGIALAVSIGVAVVLWSQDPVYRMVDPNLPAKYKMELINALQSAGIEYRLESDSGAVMVPIADLQHARLQLANSGVPLTSEKGYELLETDPGFGTSQRMEAARFQRALEGELTRSIRSLRSVEQARVHLALPERSVFVRDRTPASASVVLQLYPGRRLDESRIAGIQELVASSVPELLPEDVAVLDDQGRLLSNAEDEPATALSGRHLAMTREIEKTFVTRIENLLEPMFGHDGVRAQVTAEVDYSKVETTSENYNPDNRSNPLIRSEQILENSANNSRSSGGVPGALSNQPPQEATAEPAPAELEGMQDPQTAMSETANSNREITRNYELDRRIERVQSAPGQIRRLSVAVLVDAQSSTDTAGATETGDNGETAADDQQQAEPVSAERLAGIEALVREAVGFDEARGDSIKVSAIDFRRQTVELESLPGPPIWERDWVWDGFKQLLGALLVIILLLAVIRPTLRTLATPGYPALAGREPMALPATSGAALGLPAPEQPPQQLAAEPSSHEQRLDQARSIAERDPKRVAQLTRSWLGGDE